MSLVLETKMLTKKYRKQIAVNKVNMNIQKGDIYGLIGKNGAGKTTIMKMICGLIHSTEGDIKLFGSNDLNKGRNRMGCIIEQPALYGDMTAKENLKYYTKLLGITDYSNIDKLLDLVGLKNVDKKKCKNFSLGMKQRLSIAISLLNNPDFLILDEPINGLDPSGIKEIRELILKLNNERKITILISSHILGELNKIATKYGIIKNGTLLEEFTASELDKRCRKSITLITNDTQKASYILKNNIKSNDFKVFKKGKICIYDCLNIPEKINKELIDNDVLVSSIFLDDNDVEGYFIKMMEGNL